MANIVGIDLGTSFSTLAVIDKTGRPEVLRNSSGDNILPSCVSIDPKNMTVSVGESARRRWGISGSTDVAARFKRVMGTQEKYSLANQEYTPTDLSSLVLKKLVKEAENVVGPIRKAVITVPANFANEAREATMAAAKMAGLEVEHIINEPTAAALYYAFKNGGEFRGNYAVYDLGGGTFDISIIKVNGQDIDVLCSNGVQKLGGDDFDEILLAMVNKKYKELAGEELDSLDYNKNDAEEDKKSLSRGHNVVIRINRKLIEVTTAEFEEAISSKIAQTEMLCEATLEEAGLRVEDISQVLLAGGSTRMPIVTASVEKIFKQKPVNTFNVDEIVALGAALYAAYKSEKENLTPAQKMAIDKINLQESTNQNYGTIILDVNNALDEQKLINDILICKNQKIPYSVTKTYYTVSENQISVNCDVTECATEEEDTRFVKVLWEEKLELPMGRPAGQKVEVKFGYDGNQMMHCTFLDVATGRRKEVSLSMISKEKVNASINDFTVE